MTIDEVYAKIESGSYCITEKNEAKILAQFQIDALKAVGLFGHPKADKVYSLAWERGHSAGFHDIFVNLIELADLVLSPN